MARRLAAVETRLAAEESARYTRMLRDRLRECQREDMARYVRLARALGPAPDWPDLWELPAEDAAWLLPPGWYPG